FGEAALLEEAIQCGRGQSRRVFARRQGQLAQQRGAGAMRVLALETFDEGGQLRGDAAGLAAVLTRFGRERLETAVAVAHRPVEQSIDGNRRSFGKGDLIMAGGDLLREACGL